MIGDVHPALLAASETGSPSSLPPRTAGAGEETLPPSSPATFLALDQAARLIGHAKGHRGMSAPECGTFGLPATCGPNGEFEIGSVLGQVRQFLREQFRDPRLTHVFYEHVYISPTNLDVGKQLSQVEGIIRLTCIDYSRTCEAVAPAEWRAHFVGGRDKRAFGGDRAAMKAEARKQCAALGWPAKSEHEAEACGILAFGLASQYPDYALSLTPLFGRG